MPHPDRAPVERAAEQPERDREEGIALDLTDVLDPPGSGGAEREGDGRYDTADGCQPRSMKKARIARADAASSPSA